MSAPMQIVRLSDRRWVQIAVKILKLGENSNATVWTIGNTAQTLVHDLDLTKFGNKTFQFQRMEIHFPTQDFRIVFARGAYSSLNGNLDFNTFRTSRQSASYDEIYLPPTGSLTPEQANSLDKIITEVTFERFAESPKQNDDLTRIVLSQLDQLRTLSLEFSERQLQAEKNLEARFSKKQSNFDKEMIEARNNLEDDKKKLEAYRLQINDREPQHERRRLREALTNDLRETLSSSTPSSSATVNRVFYFYFLASIALLIVSAVYAIEAFGNLDAAFWARTIRSTLAGIAGVAFAWAGLSGLRNAAISERYYEKSVRRGTASL